MKDKRSKIFNEKFIIKFSFILVSLVIAEIVYFLSTVWLLPMIPESNAIAPLSLIAGICLAIFSGMGCYKWLNNHFFKKS